jgi:hypothetical protein
MLLRLLPLSLLLTNLVAAQAPRIGIIDFYGLEKVSQTKLRQALGAKEGDPLPSSMGDAEERLNRVPGVVESHLEAVCCDSGKMILYVGIEERGSLHFDVRDAPTGEVTLPEEITSKYREFLQAEAAATRRGENREDLTQGHALSEDPETRAIEELFIPLAKEHLKELRDVLRNSSDEEQRATAVYVMAYTPKKTMVVDDLMFALRDADAGVRSNAVRSLVAMAVLVRLHPDPELKISPTWFIEMLNSLSWTDRSKALLALQILTDNRDASVLDQLRDRALTSLAEMARWKSLEHALPAYVLLGRMVGMPEQQIQDDWSRGNRESVIAQATSRKKR